MRTVIIKKRVGTFGELSPEIQEKVINYFRDRGPFIDYDFIIEDFCSVMEENGVNVDSKHVYFSGFYSQGDGSCFSGKVFDFIIEEKAIDDNAKLYRSLESEYEYCMSDEYIKDMIKANEFEFNLETGEVF